MSEQQQPDPKKPGAQLRLRPFPAMRFDPAVVGDISEVTSPPYDVMDRRMIDDLLNEHPRNIVRLILPRMVSDPVRAENPYARAAKLLRRWREHGVLRTDEQAGLYVYEYGDAVHRVCGLVGALELRKRASGVVLPHEGVIPQIVADRLAMLVSSRANLEPILLVYDGQGATHDILHKTQQGQPLIDVHAQDGTFHRVWSITDRPSIRAIRVAMAPHQALIADGHHRYATYMQLRKRHRSIGDGNGPWDRGLALLIDQSEYPLQLGAIHRSVSELAFGDLTAPTGFELSPPQAIDGLPEAPDRPGLFVLSDGQVTRTVRLTATRDHAVSDAELLHERLLPAWGSSEDQVGYHHTVEQTLHNAHQDDGIAVLLHPTTVAEVMDVARAGKMMPRKSTSFGPKPRMGLLMRSFDDEA
ncbi:MAG: DUF1015 domain-containing protein [Nocardioidaceae bacterium]